MKTSKISFKVFFSFLMVMTLTFLSFFLIMRSFRVKEFEKMHNYYREISILAFTEIFNNSFKPYSTDEIINNRHYLEMFNQITEKYQLKVVITDTENRILLHNYSNDLPADFTKKINIYKDAAEKLKNPFPVVISRQTGNGESVKIFLFNGISIADNDFLLHMLFTLLFAVNLLLLFFISRWLTRPLEKFKQGIRSISDGDYSTPITVHSHDEFDDLAATINSMAAKIEQTMIEQKEVSANISHELRSPLTRIKVALQILKELAGECKEQDLNSYFNSIDKNIDDMDGLIDGILKFYRMDSDCNQTKHNVDIVNLLNEELNLQQSYFDHLKIPVEKDFQVESASIRIFPSIKTAFSNIISNAAKYSAADGHFKIRVEKQAKNISITFENKISQNSGIDMKKLIIPFYRGKNSSGIKGYGMGLAITKKIIENNNAKIDFSIEQDLFTVIIQLKTIH